MKSIRIPTLAAALCCLFLPLAAEEDGGEAAEDGGSGLVTEKTPDEDWSIEQRASYILGYRVRMQAENLGLDVEKVLEGFEDGSSGSTDDSKVDPQIWQKVMTLHAQEVVKRMAQENLAEGKEYLAAKREEEGVEALESGILYEVLRDAKGKSPEEGDTVRVHYRGEFIDGQEFDSTYDADEPATFPLVVGSREQRGVIEGWVKSIPEMTVGSKYRFHIPAHLAYGSQGRRGMPPNSVLVFTIELLGIVEGGAGVSVPGRPPQR